MEHKKDIGKAIKDKLGAFDKAPGEHLWAAIEADLPKKKKRRLLPFWITFISVAVIGLLLWSLLGNPEKHWPSTNGQTGKGRGSESENVVDRNANDPANANNANGIAPSTNDNDSGTGNPADGANAAGNNASQSTATDAAKTASAESSNGNARYTINVEPSNNGNAQGMSNPAKRAAAGKKSTSGRNAVAKKKSSKSQSRSQNAGGNAHDAKTSLANNAKQSAANGNAYGRQLSADGASNSNTNTAGTTSAIENATVKADSLQKAKAAKTAEQIAKTNDSIAKALAEKKKKTEKLKDSLAKQDLDQETFKTFRIFLYAAPTVYNTFSKISSIDKDLDSLPRKAEITYNYGGYLCFDYDDKWAFRVGIAKTNLKHRTQGIPVSSLDQQNYYNVDCGSISNLELQDRFADSERFDLVQDITYVEFPVELKYKIIGDKIGIEGIGGASTSLLKGNSVIAESDHNGSVVIGSTKDQYKAYFSINVGAGFYWRFADNFRLNVEPIFKYHFRTASTALQPYSVVVLGGLEYTFNWRTKKKDDKK